MTTKAAAPIVLATLVVAGAGCAARLDAVPAQTSPAAVPRNAPQVVSSRPAPTERAVTGDPIATPPTPTPAKDVPSPSTPAYVFAPGQVATAHPSATPSGSPASDPATSAPSAAATRDGRDGRPRAIPGELRLAVVAPVKAIATGAILSVDVMASSNSAIVDAPLHLLFDPSVLEFVDGTPGDFLTQGGSSVVFLADGTSVPGDVAVAAGRVEREHGASGAGLLCRVRFRGIGAGTTPVAVVEAKVWGTGGETLTVLAGRTDVVVH